MENLKRLFILLAFSAILFCSAVYADSEYCAVNGSGEGALAFSRNNGVYFTSFGNSITVDSASNRFSYVLPLNTSLFATPAFTDKDYELNNGIYSETTSGFTSIYKVSVFGHPRISPTEVSTYTEMLPGLTGNFNSVPVGTYNLEYTVKDESILNPGLSGTVRDADCVVPIDVYIMDLAEKTRTVYMKQGDVYRIDLSTIPASFPHENICYVSVAWAMMPMPGMPMDSDLYTDAACSAANMILPDTTGGISKKWQVGSVPQYIYFKMPSSGYKTIYLSLYAANSYQDLTLAEKNVSFANTGLYCHLARNATDSFFDYVNEVPKTFEKGLWRDNKTISGFGFDGFAYEAYPYQNDAATEDKNTPFIVKRGDKLKLTSLVLTDTGTNTYNGDTDFITGAGYEYSFNSSHFDVVDLTGYRKLFCRSNVESTQAVSNTVGIKYLSLPWKITTSTGSNIAAGSCDIKVYVPCDTPLTTLCSDRLYDSLMSVSCSAAAGASSLSEVFPLLWKKFQSCCIELSDGRVLAYYGSGNSTPDVYYDTDELIRYADGRCGHWSRLFVDTLRCQGIDVTYNDRLKFWIKEVPSANIMYDELQGKAYYNNNGYHDYDAVGLKQKGPRFQGGGDPDLADFSDHVINKYNNKLYDVTCGKGGYEDSQSGFLQYLRENCYITVNDQTVCTGNDLELCYFETNPVYQGGI